jgi:hypothetical protein
MNDVGYGASSMVIAMKMENYRVIKEILSINHNKKSHENN